MTVKTEIHEADMKARFLLADIQAALDRIPDSELPAVNACLERALESARAAMETKKREGTARRLK